jgi:hypothetical protein
MPIDVAHVVNGLTHGPEQVVCSSRAGLGKAVDARARQDVVTCREW